MSSQKWASIRELDGQRLLTRRIGRRPRQAMHRAVGAVAELLERRQLLSAIEVTTTADTEDPTNGAGLSTVNDASPGFGWAFGTGAGSDDQARAVTTDSSGNVYITGAFTGTVDFDPGPGTLSLTSAGYDDVFVAKYAPSGSLIWAWAGGTSDSCGYGIAVGADGSVYTTGAFSGAADFDPGPGTYNLTSNGGNDIFVSKLDASGNFLWARAMGGTSSRSVGMGIAVSADGSIYVGGHFYNGTVDLDPGPGTYLLTSAGYSDIFVSKLDASGNFLWARSMGGSDYDYDQGIAVGADGSVYITGQFRETVDFDPGSGTYYLSSAGNEDIFVNKLDASGNFLWARAMGGSGYDQGYGGIAVSADGSVYTSGYFQGTVDFDPGSGTYNLTGAGYYDIFISKLDASGNFVWARAMGGSGNDSAHGTAISADGGVYTTGYFQGTADLDPGSGTYNLISAGGTDTFVSKLDASGNFLWARAMAGTGDDFGWGIAVGADRSIYTTGWFCGTADFDPGSGTYNLTSTGGNDVFVCRFGVSSHALGDRVWLDANGNGVQDAGETGVAGAGVELYSTDNSTIGDADDRLEGTAVTDAGGNYSITASLLDGGSYYLIFRAPVGYTFTSPYAGSDGTIDSDASASGVTGLFTLSAGQNDLTRDAGLVGAPPDFGWALRAGAGDSDVGRGIATDPSGNVFVAGAFQGTVDFDSGPGTFSLTSAGSYDVFVAKYSFSGALLWARAMGGSGEDYAYSIALSADGSIYTSAMFWGTADFDPGPGTYNLTSAGGYDMFISKLDDSGNFVWARAMGGSGWDEAADIAVSADGSVYTTGFFENTVDFDPGPGTYTLTSGPDGDVFVSKLNASGNFLWARSMGGSGVDCGFSITVGADGSVYTAGQFYGTADFDPGPGSCRLTSAGDRDIFVSKLDASGSFVWVRGMGGPGDDLGRGVAVSVHGNIYMTGWFSATADFDLSPGTCKLTSAGNRDIFVAEYSASGALIWARAMGGPGDDLANDITVSAGGVYTAGEFYSTADFDPGSGAYNLTSAGDRDIFVSKLNTSGSFVWARRMGGSSVEIADDVAVSADGSVYTTGNFQGTADFDPGPGTYYLTPVGSNDIFVSTFRVNNAPVAIDDAYSTKEDVALTIPAPGVLANDTDPEDEPLTAIFLTRPNHGTLTPNPDGSISYTPDINYNGVDSFTYVANDGAIDSNVATVTIAVLAVNDAPTVLNPIVDVTVDEDAAPTLITLASVFADVDIATNGDTLSYSVASDKPGLVTAAIVDGKVVLSYAANQNGTASITVTATDSAGASASDTFSVTVNAVNDDPVAAPGSINTNEDSAVTIDLRTLVEDVETGDDSLIFSVSGAVNGSVELLADRHTAQFTPNANYNGPASFLYTVTDSGDGASVALSGGNTVSVTVAAVNDAPTVAAPIADVKVEEDAADQILDLSAVFADVDIATNGDSLSYDAVSSNPSLVTATVSGTNLTLHFLSNQKGSATVTVTATDTAGLSASDTLAVTVNSVNDTPTGRDTTVTTLEDSAYTILVGDFGFSDPNDSPANGFMAVQIATLPAAGTLTLGNTAVLAGQLVSVSDIAEGKLKFVPAAEAHESADAAFMFYVQDDGGGDDLAASPNTMAITIQRYAGITLIDGILRIVGGIGVDTITIAGGTLVVNGAPVSLAGVSEIRIWSDGGNDAIDLGGTTIPSFVDAGTGNDSVTGGSASDTVLGGDGNDTVTGAGGDDLLLGGAGADQIIGSSGNDVLVADDFGPTATLDTLRQLQQYWSDRLITAAETNAADVLVEQDGATDNLTGAGGEDWFIVSRGDKVNGLGRYKDEISALLSGTLICGEDAVTVIH